MKSKLGNKYDAVNLFLADAYNYENWFRKEESTDKKEESTYKKEESPDKVMKVMKK